MSKRTRLSRAERREVIERVATEVFAQRGYPGASIDEIARRAGVSPPVVYDHFASKLELHRRLLERQRDDLLAMWREALAGDAPAAERIPRAFDAWARHIEANPYATRMFFRETSGDPEVQAVHAAVRAQAGAALGAILGAEAAAAPAPDPAGARGLEMAAEVMRSGLIGLALWWQDHPEVPREQIVATAVDVLWLGFERVRAGERWAPG